MTTWRSFAGKTIPAPPIKVTEADLPKSQATTGKPGLGRFSVGQVSSMGNWLVKLMDLPGGTAGVLGDTPANFIKRGDYATVIYSYVNYYFSSNPATNPSGSGPQGGDVGGVTPELTGLDISSPLAFLQDLWGTITSASFWIRAVELILGIGLVGIGVAHLSGVSNPVSKVYGAVK